MTAKAKDIRNQGYKTKVHSSPLVKEIARKLLMGENPNQVLKWHNEQEKTNPELPELNHPNMMIFSKNHLKEFINLNPQLKAEMPTLVKPFKTIYDNHEIDVYEELIKMAKYFMEDYEELRKSEKNLTGVMLMTKFSKARTDKERLIIDTLEKITNFEIEQGIRPLINPKAGDTTVVMGEGSVFNYAKFEQKFEEGDTSAIKSIIDSSEDALQELRRISSEKLEVSESEVVEVAE